MQRLVALDLGSGGTKMEVLDRDGASGGLTLHEIERRQCQRGVGLKDDLDAHGGSFSPAVTEELLGVLADLLALAAAQQPAVPQEQLRCAAVATAAFREAANGEAVCAEIQRRLGLAVQIVTQTEEAQLGFLSAVEAAGPDADPRSVVVFDMGSGSFQVAALRRDGGGSAEQPQQVGDFSRGIGFTSLIHSFQTQVRGADTGNFEIRLSFDAQMDGAELYPVSAEDVAAFASFVDGVLDGDGEDAVAWLQAVLAEPSTQVLGIGGIPLMLPAVATRAQEVTLVEVEAAVERRVGLTSEEIKAAEPELHPNLVPWMLLP